MLIAMPPEQIVLFKSIVESYDNIATLRTEDPVRHHLRIYFSPDSRDEIEAGRQEPRHVAAAREADDDVVWNGAWPDHARDVQDRWRHRGAARSRSGPGDLAALLSGHDTWEVG